MKNNRNTREDSLLGQASLVAAFKVTGLSIYTHNGDDPYIQISIDGFVLDSMGGVLFSNIQFNADIDEPERISSLEDEYSEGSIHWVDSDTFSFGDSTIYFFNPETKPVPSQQYNEIDEHFPRRVHDDSEIIGKKIYWGGLFVEGKGQFHGHNSQRTLRWDDVDR